MDTDPFNFGLRISAAARGITAEDVLRKKASVDTVSNHKAPGYGAVQRLVCKYAAEAFKESGKLTSFPYHVYEKLASTKNWYPTLDPYYDAAVSALGKVHGGIRKEAHNKLRDEVFSKEAGIRGSLLSAFGKITPEIWKSLLTAGAGMGLTGGAATWLANRSVEEDKPEIESMKAKIQYYNQLSDEIEGQLASRGVPARREDVETMVNDII